MADRHFHLSKQCTQLWKVVDHKDLDDTVAQLVYVRLGLDHLEEIIHTTAGQVRVCSSMKTAQIHRAKQC